MWNFHVFFFSGSIIGDYYLVIGFVLFFSGEGDNPALLAPTRIQ